MPVQPRLLNLSVYINDHLSDELTLEVLAARMNLSPFHFHRKFRAYFGESLHQHIKRLRLEQAAYTLMFRMQPVSAVAMTSGYRTLSAFSHAFSAHFGVAPTRYRDVMFAGAVGDIERALTERIKQRGRDAAPLARIEHVVPRSLAFLRARVEPSGDAAPVCAAADTLTAWLGAQPAGRELFVSTVDLFGITTSQGFRVDVGRDIETIDPEDRARLGQVDLPGGRMAVFEHTGDISGLMDTVRSIFYFWAPGSGERTRTTPHWVSTASDTAAIMAGRGQFRIYVPLEVAAGVSEDGGIAPGVEMAVDAVGQS